MRAFLAAGVSFAVIGWAGVVIAADAVDLGEVLVTTPCRVPVEKGTVSQNVDVISREDIASSPARTVGELLEQVTGAAIDPGSGRGR